MTSPTAPVSRSFAPSCSTSCSATSTPRRRCTANSSSPPATDIESPTFEASSSRLFAVTTISSGDSSSACAGNATNSSEPKGQELVYSARVSLDRTQMQVEDKMVNLSPGMAVTVEIKTGTRRILSYVLSPLVRYKQEVLRER